MVLIRSEPFGQFDGTLTADYKYSRYILEDLSQQVPRPISSKPKTFSEFFLLFLKSKLNLEYLETKYQSLSLSIMEIINCETGSHLNLQKAIFHATLQQITC